MAVKKKNEKIDENAPVIEPVVLNQPLVEEMKSSYLDYAMSVIVSRALPDVRDGLKPVHRKILYSMWNLGLRSTAKYKKSATVVGDVLGKYHPHGDVAIYDSLVRMAQDFAMRYRLVNGQGNFGSIDGDSAAAMRYTEAKLMAISDELLTDLDKNTVDFVPNYDGSRTEPVVLPAKLPNLLLNGSVGIAVGMATNIPPHNLREVCDATIHLINNPEANIDDLMEFVKGPDFPTGGTIYNINDIKSAFATGKGSIVMRGTAEIEEVKGGHQIIITDLPYQVNKASLLEKIAELVKDKKIEGIKDLRDESNRHGIRVVVELKRDSYPKKVLNALYKFTQLQEKFHVNMLALVDGLQPKVLTLKMVLEEFIKHRQIVVKRRAEFDLNKAKDREHILEGLFMALEDIDKIIDTIKKSKDKEDARINLIKRFKLSERQAVAILEMRLQQLANLERLKVEEELKEKRKLIKELETLLASKKKMLQVVEKELTELRDKYGDDRKTRIIKGALGSFSTEDLIPNESTLVMLTHDGYIKRLPPDTFKVQVRGGKGVAGVTTKEEDMVQHMFATNTHADLWFFTTKGRLFQLKAYDVPQASRTAKGQAIVNFLQLAPEEKVATVLTSEDITSYKYLVMVSRQGLIKKTEISAFSNIRKTGLIVVKLKGNDVLQWIKPSTGKDDVMLVTAEGQSIRFKEKDIRAMGRAAAGVRGVRLSKKGDEVVGMDMLYEGKVSNSEHLLVIMDNGYGKRTPLTQYKLQGRGGSGIKTAMITPKTGKLCSAFIVNALLEQEDLVVISEKGQLIRIPLKAISVIGRATQGVRIMKFKQDGDKVASVTFI